MTERAVDDALAVGRYGDAPQCLDLKLRRVDLLGKAQCLVDRLLDVGGKRDRRRLAGCGVDSPDLAFSPDDDCFVIRHPGVLRIEAMYRPRLLQILVEVIEQRAVAAGLELAQVQLAVSADAADV